MSNGRAVYYEGMRIRGRYTNKPGTITKYNPIAQAAYVHFDGDEREYPCALNTGLHLVPFEKPSIYAEVADELDRARRKFPGAQNSPHEGWAVLQEEVDELWDDVKGNASRETMRKEAIQVAAIGHPVHRGPLRCAQREQHRRAQVKDSMSRHERGVVDWQVWKLDGGSWVCWNTCDYSEEEARAEVDKFGDGYALVKVTFELVYEPGLPRQSEAESPANGSRSR